MALFLEPQIETLTDQFSVAKRYQCENGWNRRVKFADNGAAATLGILTPLGYNESLAAWAVWSMPTQDIDTIGVTTAYTGGTFTVTVDGNETANISNSASAAAVLSAIELLPNVAVGDFTVVEETAGGVDAGAGGFIITSTLYGQFRGVPVAVTADFTSLTGGTGAAIASTQAGVASYGADIPKAFTLNEVLVYNGSESTGSVMLKGSLHVDDVEGITAGAETTDFQEIMKRKGVELDFLVNGLDGIH